MDDIEYLGFTRVDVLGLPLSNASTLDRNITRAIERDNHLNGQEAWARFVTRAQIAFEMMRDYAFRAMEAMASIEADDHPDQGQLDLDPDLCWRCNARTSTGELGLCEPCHTDLVDKRDDL